MTKFAGFDVPGTTAVPDILFDELLSELTGNELKALLYIIRRTYGFQKQADAISISQFREGITTHEGKVLDKGCGIKHNRTILVALTALEKKGYITTQKRQTPQKDKDTTIYKLRFKASSDKGVVTSSNQRLLLQVTTGSYSTSRRVVTSSNIQETVLQQTDSQETVLQQGGEEKKKGEDSSLAPSSCSDSHTVQETTPTREPVTTGTHATQEQPTNAKPSMNRGENIPSTKKTFQRNESQNIPIPLFPKECPDPRTLTPAQQKRAAEMAAQAERAALWELAETVMGTTYPQYFRTMPSNTKGLDTLLEARIPHEQVKMGLERMTPFERNKFSWEYFLSLLPNKLSASYEQSQNGKPAKEVQPPPMKGREEQPAGKDLGDGYVWYPGIGRVKVSKAVGVVS